MSGTVVGNFYAHLLPFIGEEGGLLGSRDVFNSYVGSGVDVLAVMNQDMTGYSPNNVIAVYTDYADTSLTSFIQKLVPVYTSLPLSTDRCGYGCSDQYVPHRTPMKPGGFDRLIDSRLL